MAHISNFEIPARFTFLPYLARWVTCSAEILGWSDIPSAPLELLSPGSAEEDEMVLVKLNFSSAGNGSEAQKTAQRPGDAKIDYADMFSGSRGRRGEDTSAPIPAGRIGSGANQVDQFAPSYTVEISPSHIPDDALRPHENRRNTPDISGRHFTVLASPRPGLASGSWAPKSGGIAKDAWKMRDEFLNLKPETNALCLFLNHWGLWDRERGYARRFFGELQDVAIVIPHLVWKRREQYRSALVGKPRKWLSTTSSLFLSESKEPPYFTVQRSYCEAAIRTTITIDHLSKAEFGICRLINCRKLYKRETKQKRMYCTTAHAHLANVRKSRAEKKKKSKRRNHATRKG